MKALTKEFQEISREILTLKGLVDSHIQALNDYYEKLVSAGVEPDKNRIMNYVETVITPVEKKLIHLRERVDREIGKIESWILEYENAEIVLKDDFERALEKLNSDKEGLEDIRAGLQRLEEELNAIRGRYQEW